ncbi:MAG: MJ1477/TM1410 family putative glycoside hydrolase [Planctomycetota bacterium]
MGSFVPVSCGPRFAAFAIGVALLAGCASEAPRGEPAPGVVRARPAPAPLARVTSWGYWLQGVDPERVAQSPFGLIVTDPSRDGSRAGEWDPAAVARLRSGARLALAYLSVGEAEDYRGYWRPEWKERPPAWLGAENPEWKGNYPVRFWDPGWQALFLADDGPLLRLIRAGFDGVYLDRVDVYEHWAAAGSQGGPQAGLDEAEAARRMSAFVLALARRARAARPGFLVVVQNAPALAVRPEVLRAIDGVALESTFYVEERPQDPAETREVLGYAQQVRSAGKPVFSVDYCRDPTRVADAYRRARAAGLVPYSTVRALDRLVVGEGKE